MRDNTRASTSAMTSPDPLHALKEELEEAGRKEAGWLRLALRLAEDGADAAVVKEAWQRHHAARARRESLAEYLRLREATAQAVAPEQGRAAVQRGDCSILVVDDHAPTRYATARALRACGFRTMEGAGGADALELAPYASGLVLDVHLPDLDGFQVCRLLRERPGTARLPVIHLSARHVTAADRATGLAAGADDYFVAPADPLLLARRLDHLLAGRG